MLKCLQQESRRQHQRSTGAERRQKNGGMLNFRSRCVLPMLICPDHAHTIPNATAAARRYCCTCLTPKTTLPSIYNTPFILSIPTKQEKRTEHAHLTPPSDPSLHHYNPNSLTKISAPFSPIIKAVLFVFAPIWPMTLRSTHFNPFTP